MADVKISQLPVVTTVAPTDVAPVVASSTTSKITIQDLATSLPLVNSASYAVTASYAMNGGGVSSPPFPYTGSALITGSLGVTGSISSTIGFTGSLLGTASWARNVVSSSYSLTASYAISSSYVLSSSVAISASYVLSSSYSNTASYIDLSQTASFVTASNVWGPFGSNSVLSSSYALTASYALNGGGVSTPPFPYTGSALITGSLEVTGSISSTDGFTGSLLGTASWAIQAITASYTTSASYALSSSQAISASYVLTSSYSLSASYALTSSISYNSLTASSADAFFVRQDLTASNALFTGTITAQKLSVQYITASTEYVTGSSKFGSQLTDTHQFTGSVSITGSLTVAGTLSATASWAQNSITASYVTASNVWGPLGSNSIISASYALTASFALNAGGAGSTFPYTGSAIISGSLVVTGSVASSLGFTGSLLGSASYALTSSVAGYSRIQESQYRFQNFTVLDQDVWLNSGSIVKVVTSSGVSTAEYSLNGGSYTAFTFTGDTWTGNISVAPKDTFSWRITYRSGYTTAALIVVSNITIS